ncbi:MAG: gamma-glutamyltransferase [Hyphomicrobiales bacterium]|nr:gamma-glutamyltransferase [Hyphomicrobiales bacterium]
METPVFSRAAVAAPHHAAARAGKAVLAEGGDAIEAMLAMAAAIAVVYPHMNSIGGDAFWLIREPAGRVRYIEACGFAGARATIESYRAQGHAYIPRRGAGAALTVPGAVGGWALAHAFSQARGGKLPLKALLHDAIGLAREGFPQSASEARLKLREIDALEAAPGFAQTFYVDGKRAGAGAVRRFEKLGAALAHLAEAGLEDFYRGDVGREIAADLAAIGAPVVREDLERYRAVMREPLALKLPGRTLYNAPPPTAGLASLALLGIFERLGVKRAESFEHIHGLVEASKQSFVVRNRACVDYDMKREDPEGFLVSAGLQRMADAIDMKRAAPWPLPPGDGDTIWMGAIDGDGLAVSYIQSIFWDYGSGCVLPQTGVLLQNRGVSFSLDAKNPNALAPGKRPMHTLNPPLCVFDDGRVLSYGAMGGDGQPQFQAQVMTRFMFGAGLADAIDAPRFRYDKSWRAGRATLKLEDRFDPSIVSALEKAGHEIETHPGPYDDSFGHAGGLLRHPGGRIEAAHDPRADGGAEGI